MKRFRQLVAKDIFGCLTTEEREELRDWCEKKGMGEEEYEGMKRRVCSPELHREILLLRPGRRFPRHFVRYAAVWGLPFLLACYFLLGNFVREEAVPVAVAGDLYEKPQPKAVQLILGDGKTVRLDRKAQEEMVAPRTFNTGSMLEYQRDTVRSREMEPVFHTVVVPAGGEFKVRLSDGTQVWLNENTRLYYPVEFAQELREIHLLEGEIYLEVAKEVRHPFLVRTPNGKAEVLGTRFNVRCVSPGCVETTLAEGRVRVSGSSGEVVLEPGQQATVTDRIAVAAVDVEEVVCWKNHLFYFKDAGLETILNRLADWYGFSVRWISPELKTKRFFISIDRYASVGEILEKLSEVSEVCFSVHGRTVSVSR